MSAVEAVRRQRQINALGLVGDIPRSWSFFISEASRSSEPRVGCAGNIKKKTGRGKLAGYGRTKCSALSQKRRSANQG